MCCPHNLEQFNIGKGLTLKGYAVDQAESGSIGLQMALDEEYDLVVLDLNLPGKDGLQVLSELKAEKPQSKVLILSANYHLETKLSGFELGASDYLTKPFHFEELEARIRVLLNRKFIQEHNILTCYIITPYHKCIFCDNSLWYEHHETL